MIGSTLVLIIAAIAVPSGQVTTTTGVVKIERGGRMLGARIRSGFEPGDRVTTGRGAGAGLFLYDGQSVYIGPDTALSLSANGDPLIQIEQGELRATADSPRGLTVVAGAARARVGRGTVWAAIGSDGVRFRAEHGTARVIAAGQPPLTLTAGQAAIISPAGAIRGPVPADTAAWTIPLHSLQLAGAAAESRRGKVGRARTANDEVATEFAGGPRAGGPRSDETRPGSGDNPVPNENQLPNANANQDPNQAENNNETYQPTALSQTGSSFSSVAGSLALSGASGAFSFAGSGGLGNDAQQDSRNAAFPGNIFLVTALSRYSLKQVHLTGKDTRFPTDRQYFSIGVGAPPTSRVQTNFQTGTGAVPDSIRIPRFNAYVLQLSQYNISDPATAPSNTALTGISGLLGAHPISPQIQGATPLLDPRASFNDRATFALGEFALQRDPNHTSIPQFEIRRSDQDRLIVPGTGPADPVVPNPQIYPRYSTVVDSKFFPDFPKGVKVPDPNGFRPAPTLTKLDLLRKAAVTTLLADKLLDYSHRTGQTQFVVDGQIIDTAGYHRNLETPKPVPESRQSQAKLAGPGNLAAAATRSGAVTATRKPGRLASTTLPRGTGFRGARPGLRSFGPRPEAGRSGAAAQVAAVHRRGGHH